MTRNSRSTTTRRQASRHRRHSSKRSARRRTRIRRRRPIITLGISASGEPGSRALGDGCDVVGDRRRPRGRRHDRVGRTPFSRCRLRSDAHSDRRGRVHTDRPSARSSNACHTSPADAIPATRMPPRGCSFDSHATWMTEAAPSSSSMHLLTMLQRTAERGALLAQLELLDRACSRDCRSSMCPTAEPPRPGRLAHQRFHHHDRPTVACATCSRRGHGRRGLRVVHAVRPDRDAVDSPLDPPQLRPNRPPDR